MPQTDIDTPVSDTRPQRIGYLLLDGFAMLSYAAIAEPFRAANVLSGRTLYAWSVLSSDGGAIAASSGARLAADAALDGEAALDLLFVLAAGNPSAFDDRSTFARLRRLAARGVRLGGISGGPYVLARAGLLDGHRCTIHWEHRPGFVEAFPRLRVDPDLFVIDRQRITGAGGTSGLDLAVALIAADHGAALATQVGDWHLGRGERRSEDAQRAPLAERWNTRNPRLLAALAQMETSIAEPLPPAQLAATTGVSVRQLERLFAGRLGKPIGAVYLSIRLDRSMALLRETALSVSEVAVACGFASTSHFARVFKARFGAPPGSLSQR